MGNKSQSESTDSTSKDQDMFVFRTNPTCKTLQQDLANVHNIIRNTKDEITTSIAQVQTSTDAGFVNITNLLTDNNNGVIPRLNQLETLTGSYKTRLSAVEEKLALVEASESVILQSSPAHEAAIVTMKTRLDTTVVILSQFEKKFESVNSRVLHNTQLVNVNKYKISGIPVVEGETPYVSTKNFLTNIMKVVVNDGDIIVASHLPRTLTVHIDGNRVQLPSQMFVKVTPHLQRRIASNLGELEGQTDPTNGHYY